MFGGSIEAGGASGLGTIDIETGGAYADAIHFENVYFENTHQFMLRSRGTKTVSFRGCKITGTGAGGKGMVPYSFDCGDDLIVFADNHWDLPTVGPRNMLLYGQNDRLSGVGNLWRLRSGRSVELESRRFSPDEALQGLFTVACDAPHGRAYGTLELFVDTGPDRPLRRAVLPIDLAMTNHGVSNLAAPQHPDFQLVPSFAAEKTKFRLHGVAALAGTRRLWFKLDLAADAGGSIDVSVL